MTANTTGPASKTHPIELLRRIDPGAWADVRDPSGWTYSTNIGVIAQTCRAAWEADRAALERARALLAELAACGYECQAGALENNQAYRELAAALASGGAA